MIHYVVRIPLVLVACPGWIIWDALCCTNLTCASCLFFASVCHLRLCSDCYIGIPLIPLYRLYVEVDGSECYAHFG